MIGQQVDVGFWVTFLFPAPLWMIAGWLLKVAWDDAREADTRARDVDAREEARRRHPSSQPRVGQWTERWEEDDHGN